MRDLIFCYNEEAVKVSDCSCSGSGSSAGSVVSAQDRPPLLNSVTCVYRSILSTQKQFIIAVTWSTALIGQGLSLSVNASPQLSGAQCFCLRKKKGSRSLSCSGSVIVVHWDISAARYGVGPEPVEGFYIAVVADGEQALLLGDRRRDEKILIAEFGLMNRRETVSGSLRRAYTTRVRLRGREHEISVAHGRDAELVVCVDGLEAVRVWRLMWNFRGNRMIFVDGTPVDVMWDVHDWWFGSGNEAVFMFRERKSLESWLWMEEDAAAAPPRSLEFSLLIYSSKSKGT